MYVVAENVTYFGSFKVQHILKEIRKFITNKNVTLTFCRILAYDLIMCKYICIAFIDFMLLQAYDLIMCEYFCIVFVDFMLQGDYSTQIYFLIMNIENDKILVKYFQYKLN